MSKEPCDCENPVHDCHFADNCRVTAKFQKTKIRSSELKPIEEITKPYRDLIEAQAKEIEELKASVDRLTDTGIDKIMAMSDEQINALAAQDHRSPDDQATIAKQCFKIAELRAALDKCLAERK